MNLSTTDKQASNMLAKISRRLLKAGTVMFVAAGLVLGGGVAANAGSTLFANYVWKAEDARVTSGKSTLKGGQSNLHMDFGGMVNATSYGLLKTGNGSTAVTRYNWTGGRQQFAGGSGSAWSSAYAVSWWNFPGTIVGNYPLSAKTIW